MGYVGSIWRLVVWIISLAMGAWGFGGDAGASGADLQNPAQIETSVQAEGEGVFQTASVTGLSASDLEVSGNPLLNEQKQIMRFLQSRARHVMSAQPDATGLLSGQTAGAFNANVTRDYGKFNYASRKNQPVWAELRGQWSEYGTRKNTYFSGIVSTYTQMSKRLVMGVTLKFDQTRQSTGANVASGSGVLAGPYFVAKHPNHGFYFGGCYLLGRTNSKFSYGTLGPTSFNTQRSLVSFKVAGDLKYDRLILTPNLSATHYTDRQRSFMDQSSRRFAPQEIAVSQMSLGLNFNKGIGLYLGQVTLRGGVSGIYSSSKGKAAARTVLPGYEGGRARATLGGKYALETGVTLQADTFYDGIGVDNYKNFGVNFGVKMKF